MMNNLNLAGLNFILAHAISFSRMHRIHLLPITNIVVTVRSSVYALIRGWCTSVFIISPQHSIYGQGKESSWECTASNDTPLKSMPVGNYLPRGDSHLKIIIKQPRINLLILPGTWCFFRAFATNLCRMELYAFTRSNHKTVRSPLLSLVSLYIWVTTPICSRHPRKPGIPPYSTEVSM